MEELEQQIFAALQTKFPGVDAKILGRIAKKKAKTATAEADANTIADGITLQQVIDSHADYKATCYDKKHAEAGRMKILALSVLTKRSDRDSNSGYPFGVYTLSRRASSATRAPLH